MMRSDSHDERHEDDHGHDHRASQERLPVAVAVAGMAGVHDDLNVAVGTGHLHEAHEGTYAAVQSGVDHDVSALSPGSAPLVADQPVT